MRHYFWLDTNGEIRGQETHDGGFPTDCDPRDEDTAHHVAKVIRAARTKNSDHGGWHPFDCECPAGDKRCQCATLASVQHFVENGRLVAKPTLKVLVNGVELPGLKGPDFLDRPPGTKLVVKLRGTVPDGHTLLIRSSNQVHIIKAATTIAFNGGESPPIEVTAPAQGLKGWIFGASKYVRPFGVYVRGWA